MRKSLRRWLFQRRQPEIKPLYQRTSWYDFAGRMHRAIDIDIRIDLGEITRRELREQQKTRPLPVVDVNAPTIAEPAYWLFYDDDTIRVRSNIVDKNATEAMDLEAILR